MDGIDVEVENFDEIESRLYGQIHHDIVESKRDAAKVHQSERNDENRIERIVAEKRIVNRPVKFFGVSDKRYWSKSIKSFNLTDMQSKSVRCYRETQNISKYQDGEKMSSKMFADGSLLVHSQSKNSGSIASEKETQCTKSIKESIKMLSQKDKISTCSDLRVNPAAVASKVKKKVHNMIHLARNNPFVQQESKLQRVKKIKEKKQKSERVRNKKHKEFPLLETIVLDSSSNDDSSTNSSEDDVVLIPAKSPLTITVSDSDNENQFETSRPQLEEENAMDGCDVSLDSKHNPIDFIKPSDIHSKIDYETNEKLSDQVLSLSNSPCSAISSDDFIGQSDRCRLLENSCIADDQDLVLLTADVENLIHTTQYQTVNVNKQRIESITSSTEDVMCTAEFTAPLLNSNGLVGTGDSNSLLQQQRYRVEQTEFRALDVYESESDIADSVYSKGNSRIRTIVNAICSSSEADEIPKIPYNRKVKRLNKRRSSSCNRSADGRNNYASSDDEDNGVPTTSVSFILRGSAVERYSKRLTRTHSLSLRRVSNSADDNSGNMSDSDFIATLNSLVQVCKDVTNKEVDETIKETNNCEKDLEKIHDQEKRPITEAVQKGERSLLSVQYQSEAVPDRAMTGLDRIFASIDNLAEPEVVMKAKEVENCLEDDVDVLNPTSPVINVEYNDKQKVLPIRHIVYNDRNAHSDGVGWNEEMTKFYNLSWHGERFTLVEVQNGMERDRKLWKINSEDRFPKTRSYSNLKCFNCCEFGHTRAKCRRPKKTPVCYMCGESGHFEPRCPNTMCLRCGNKTQVYTKSCNACSFQNRLICPICKVRGHSINLCPDKWRRYHSTTQPNAQPDSRLEFNKRKMCCICGGIGHLSDTCRSILRFMEYPIIVSHVKSHQKSYNDILFKTPCVGLALNLLYRPRDTVTFRMAKKTGSNGYYARFLKAVGLVSLLKRKGESNYFSPSEKPAKQARTNSALYESNLCFPGAREGVHSGSFSHCNNFTGATEPNQVQEVSGSVVSTENTGHGQRNFLTEVINEIGTYETNGVEIGENTLISGNEFKIPNDIPATITSQQSIQSKDVLTVDSDSNYSFSDHFEVSRSDVSMDQTKIVEEGTEEKLASITLPVKQTKTAEREFEIEPLPDFIPLSSIRAVNMNDNTDNFDTQSGISRRFVAANSDDEHLEENEKEHNKPCEAKIYLTNFHSNYLLSPEGHNFLVEKSRDCKIKARLDWTSIGHVLVIFGFSNDQDTFHKALLDKCHELMNQMNDKQSNVIKVPKRIDALIRFLRENISQLQSDLGDVNDLQKRIEYLERTNTKANMKLAEKSRRLLNMILLGQAGLCDGGKHLSKLLEYLKYLINNYQVENVVPQSLREEIDCHSKLIFTSYRHDNYPELIKAYNNLSKNQKVIVNIDPLLLGEKKLEKKLTVEQKSRLEQPTMMSTQYVNHATMIEKSSNGNLPNFSYLSILPQTFVSKANNVTPSSTLIGNILESVIIRDKSNTAIKRQNLAGPPFVNREKRSRTVTNLKEGIFNRQGMLTHLKINNTTASTELSHNRVNPLAIAKRAPTKGPSLFWSREAMRYLDDCIQMSESNTELLQKLQRIQSKSVEGALSYNDYRAVIKLHGAMVGI